MRPSLRTGIDVVLGMPIVERLALRGSARAGRGLALLWHRIGPLGPSEHEVVRTVPLSDFESQLDLLVRLGDVVPLAELGRGRSGARPQFALTFDDDDPGHCRWALPALRSRGLPATFFLSGRWQDQAGPYWWEVLETQVRDRGARAVAAQLGVSVNFCPPQIAAAITGTPAADSLRDEAVVVEADTMVSADAQALTAAGMEIGFHTREHDVLPRLDGSALTRAVTDGRKELEAELQVSLSRFAYPHGRADPRVAAAVAHAGFASAWTTTKTLVRADDPPMLRGRWDLGHLPLATFRARILRALVRPGS